MCGVRVAEAGDKLADMPSFFPPPSLLPPPTQTAAAANDDTCLTLGLVRVCERVRERRERQPHTPPQPQTKKNTGPPANPLPLHSFDELSWDAKTPGAYFGDASSDDFYVTWGVLNYGGGEWSNLQVKSPASAQPSRIPVASPSNFAVAWAAAPVVALVTAGTWAPKSVWVSVQSFYAFSPALPPATFVATARTRNGLADCASAVLPPVAPGTTLFGPRVKVDLSKCAGADALLFGLSNRTFFYDSPRPPLESDQFIAFDSLELCRPRGGSGDGVEQPPPLQFLASPPKDTVNRRRRLAGATRRLRQQALLQAVTHPPAPTPAAAPAAGPPPTPKPRPPRAPPASARCFTQGLDNVTFDRTASASLSGDYYFSGYNLTRGGGGLAWANIDVVADSSPPAALASPPNYGRPHWKAPIYAFAEKGTFFPVSISVAAVCDAQDAGGGVASDARCSPPGTPPPAFEVVGRDASQGGRLRVCALVALGRAPAGGGSAPPITLDLSSCGEVDTLRLRLVPPVYGDQYSFAFDDLRVCAGGGGGSVSAPTTTTTLPPADGAAWATAPPVQGKGAPKQAPAPAPVRR